MKIPSNNAGKIIKYPFAKHSKNQSSVADCSQFTNMYIYIYIKGALGINIHTHTHV